MGVIASDNFANLNNWTLIQTDGTVTVASNEAILDVTAGGAAWNVLGARWTAPFAAAAGLSFKIDMKFFAWPISWMGIADNNTQDIAIGSPGTPGNLVAGIEFTSVSAQFLLTRGANEGQTGTFLPAATTQDSFYTLTVTLEDNGGALNAHGYIEGDGIVGVGDFGFGTSHTPSDFTGTDIYFYFAARQAAAINTNFRLFEVSEPTPPDPGNDDGEDAFVVLPLY